MNNNIDHNLLSRRKLIKLGLLGAGGLLLGSP